jgi:hypothetical protein
MNRTFVPFVLFARNAKLNHALGPSKVHIPNDIQRTYLLSTRSLQIDARPAQRFTTKLLRGARMSGEQAVEQEGIQEEMDSTRPLSKRMELEPMSSKMSRPRCPTSRRLNEWRLGLS